MSTGEAQNVEAQASVESAAAEDSVLQQAISATKQTERNRAEDLLRTLTQEALKGTVTYDKSVVKTITAAISAIDTLASKQLATVMHHPEFQKLEGTWRGLHHLVMESETGPMLKLKVYNCTKRELTRDLEKALEFDQSELFKKIYTSEYDMPGGQPYGALIGDYEFQNHPDDIGLLSKVSNVAAAAFAPFLTAASPELAGLESWTQLNNPRDLAVLFDSIEYTQWKSFRDSEDSRFVVLTMPRALARLPYGQNTKPIDEFGFEEVELGPEGKPISTPHDNYCWMNSAYVLGSRLTAAFAKTGWCTAIRGYENGGRVEGLPAHIFKDLDGDMALKCPTEISIPERREKELSDLGFLPLCHYKSTDYAVFFGAQTTQKPKIYQGPDGVQATENAAISARLPYIMATSRFAHYLKAMARDRIGSFAEATDMQKWLNDWIKEYVVVDKSPAPDVKARYPLADARVDVKEIPGKPGAYEAIAFLRPWLQLEELHASLRLVTRIPSGK